jgi:hypothetical protein
MKTVYLLKNCRKSFNVLLKLVHIGDITTNIIIVDKFNSKILKKDKRVKEFPFIINTLPTINGLIPKFATVMPFRVYFAHYRFSKYGKFNSLNKFNSFNQQLPRTITYKPPRNTYKPPRNTYKPPRNIYKPPRNIYKPPRNTYKPQRFDNLKFSPFRLSPVKKKPVIKAIKQKDESVNIILYNK